MLGMKDLSQFMVSGYMSMVAGKAWRWELAVAVIMSIVRKQR